MTLDQTREHSVLLARGYCPPEVAWCLVHVPVGILLSDGDHSYVCSPAVGNSHDGHAALPSGSGDQTPVATPAMYSRGKLSAGCCFLFGGLSNKVQTFNAVSNQVSNSLLFLAVVALVLPSAAAHFPANFDADDMLSFSRIIAVLLLIVYICYLYFQLVSHNDLFVAEGGQEEDDEEEEPALTVTAELCSLLAISLIVAAASECVAVAAV